MNCLIETILLSIHIFWFRNKENIYPLLVITGPMQHSDFLHFNAKQSIEIKINPSKSVKSSSLGKNKSKFVIPMFRENIYNQLYQRAYILSNNSSLLVKLFVVSS